MLCVASGPSLTIEDVDACRGAVDAIVAINDAARLWVPDATVAYSSDQRWWPYYHGLPDFAGLKFSIAPVTMPREAGVQILSNTGDGGIETEPTGLRTGRNSGYAAINLAVHLGAVKVLLLGYDMQRTGGKGHFFGEHPDRLRSDPPFGSYVAMFRTAVAPLKQLGVTVLNCSRESAVDAFPRVSLAEALA